jgi:hypothetical protein
MRLPWMWNCPTTCLPAGRFSSAGLVRLHPRPIEKNKKTLRVLCESTIALFSFLRKINIYNIQLATHFLHIEVSLDDCTLTIDKRGMSLLRLLLY